MTSYQDRETRLQEIHIRIERATEQMHIANSLMDRILHEHPIHGDGLREVNDHLETAISELRHADSAMKEGPQ